MQSQLICVDAMIIFAIYIDGICTRCQRLKVLGGGISLSKYDVLRDKICGLNEKELCND